MHGGSNVVNPNQETWDPCHNIALSHLSTKENQILFSKEIRKDLSAISRKHHQRLEHENEGLEDKAIQEIKTSKKNMKARQTRTDHKSQRDSRFVVKEQ